LARRVGPAACLRSAQGDDHPGWQNIYPAEIEIQLREHPAIADAAVVGIPDERYGETVAAAIVPRPGATPPSDAELIAWCRATLAPVKTPKRWTTLSALPMTPVGKVRKFLVREAVLAAADDDAQTAVTSEH
jgi:acyl-CoA synthetase (AMP-forming)/AMP-acid ligase II